VPYLERSADVFVLNLGVPGESDTENRFHPDWVAEVNALLDEVAGSTGPASLVTTATGKFYSNGLDLDWLTAHADQWQPYVAAVQALFGRILTLPMISVAALPGHTFAAGAMFALAHDRRVMRVDRGFFCFPEVDINIPFTQGMNDLIVSRLSPAAAHESMTTGRRYGGADALTAGLVDEAVPLAEVLPTAIAAAQALAPKRGDTLAAIKSTLYAPVIASLTS
jgi:enoyl-CoA hydratase/carnithine racemase